MNNVVLLLGIFLATLGLIQTSSGLTMGMSSEKILETQQLILLGTVDSVEARSGDTEYTVTVLEYVKTPAGFNKVDTLYVVGCGEGQIGGCITFDKGQGVLFILNERNGTLLVSELSFVSPNPNCTMDDIFRYNDEKYGGLSLYQDSKSTSHLYTNQPITAQYYYFNKNLTAASVDVTITVIDDFPDILKEETIHLDLEECQPNAKVEMEFVIDSPGSFAISAKVEGNGGGESFSGVMVIDYVAPPLKQFKSGISASSIQCKEGLELIIKSSDGSPACVTLETEIKLIERGWAKIKKFSHEIPNTADSTAKSNLPCDTIGDIKKITTFDIKLPTYLPQNYVLASCQAIPFEAQIMYHDESLVSGYQKISIGDPKQIANGAIYLYIINKKGVLGEEQFSREIGNTTSNILKTVKEVNEKNPSLKMMEVNINGIIGWANDRCETCGIQTANFDNNAIVSYTHTPSRIKFYDGGVLYFFQAGISLNELIKVAESLT